MNGFKGFHGWMVEREDLSRSPNLARFPLLPLTPDWCHPLFSGDISHLSVLVRSH
ncbi:hypothetical protein IQ252_08650 [Tychonema sp. LEGE 07203]|nr:hypothetical protein [Tychonema sp. LEGE 07203]